MRVRRSLFAQIGAVLSLLFCLSTISHAVERPLPAKAKVGKLSTSPNRLLLVDDEPHQLTAGAQIRTAQNTIIQPQTLLTRLATQFAGMEFPILYTENNQGQIHRMWILTRAEAERYVADEPPTLAEIKPPLAKIKPATPPASGETGPPSDEQKPSE